MLFRGACGISVPHNNNLVITGGWGEGNGYRVQFYDFHGSKQTQRLPDLHQPRWSHACECYYDSMNIVSIWLMLETPDLIFYS